MIERDEKGHFLKGVSANPTGGGRKKMPAALRQLRDHSRNEILKSMSEIMLKSSAELQRMNGDPRSTAAEVLICAIMIHAINKGDAYRAQFLMNYVLGKPAAFNEADIERSRPITLAYSNGKEVTVDEPTTTDDDEQDDYGDDGQEE